HAVLVPDPPITPLFPYTTLFRSIHAGLGRIEDAVADCEAAIRATAIGRELAYRRKGELLLRAGRPKEAVAAFDAAIGLNPTDPEDRKSTRLNSSHDQISYAVFCL